MSVLVDFVKFLLSFHNQDITSFNLRKKIFYFIGTLSAVLQKWNIIILHFPFTQTFHYGIHGWTARCKHMWKLFAMWLSDPYMLFLHNFPWVVLKRWLPCGLQFVEYLLGSLRIARCDTNNRLSLSDDKHMINFSLQYCYLIKHIGCENKEIDHQRYVWKILQSRTIRSIRRTVMGICILIHKVNLSNTGLPTELRRGPSITCSHAQF